MKNILILFLSLGVFGCSSENDKQLFDSALKKSSDKKYNEALKDYETIVKEYPDGEYASAALLETAKLYHNYVFDNISKEESIKKAVHYYKRVYKEYSDRQIAEAAMMITGFVYANELNQLDSAKTIYETFLDKYPNSQLANSIKLELENLGASPNQILDKQLGKTK